MKNNELPKRESYIFLLVKSYGFDIQAGSSNKFNICWQSIDWKGKKNFGIMEIGILNVIDHNFIENGMHKSAWIVITEVLKHKWSRIKNCKIQSSKNCLTILDYFANLQ